MIFKRKKDDELTGLMAAFDETKIELAKEPDHGDADLELTEWDQLKVQMSIHSLLDHK